MSDLEKLINNIENTLNAQWYSDAEQDLCNGCRYFESSWHLLVQALPYLKRKLWGKEEEQHYIEINTIDGQTMTIPWGNEEENNE